MTTRNRHGHPVLIIGAGRGGSALLEMFLEDSLVSVVAIADTTPDAPGLLLAKKHGIPAFGSATEALQACKDYPDCIVYNMSHDDSVSAEADRILGGQRVASGPEVKLFWQMVTNLKRVKDDLEKSQNQLQSIIHNVMDGIVSINEAGEIQAFNPAAEQIFGYSQQEVLGKNVCMLMPEADRSQHDSYLKRYLESSQGGMLSIRGREVTARRENGDLFPLEMSVSEMMLGGQRHFIGVVRDITERKLVEQKLAYFAHHDCLTELPNRILFSNSLAQAMQLAKRNHHKVAVLFLDLDGFKKINDTLGHDAGDLLLVEVAQRLRMIGRASDIVARIGGDEFMFALNNIGSTKNAGQIAEKIVAALSLPFDLKSRQCHIGVSIGVALYPDDAEDIQALIRGADEAMYLAKQSGKNTFRYYADMLREGQGDLASMAGSL